MSPDAGPERSLERPTSLNGRELVANHQPGRADHVRMTEARCVRCVRPPPNARGFKLTQYLARAHEVVERRRDARERGCPSIS